MLTIDKKHLHHAYLLVGERKATLSSLVSFLEDSLEVTVAGNPDVSIREYESFGIDDARELKEKQGNKAFGEGRKFFVIAFHSITSEAQNALLKVFEEPTEDTHIFLITSSDAVLLPTLRSRVFIDRFQKETDAKNEDSSLFLKSSLDERLKFLDRFKENDDTKKSEFQNFLSGLEETLSRQDVSLYHNELEELIRLRKFIFDRAPSVKMIGEYLALRLPVLN